MINVQKITAGFTYTISGLSPREYEMIVEALNLDGSSKSQELWQRLNDFRKELNI